MAGEWIKCNKGLFRHPKVVRIASALKADRLRTVGGLLSAWCVADEQTPDGKLDAYTPELLDDLVGMPGLSRAMESVGWLTIGDGFLEIPRFEEHNGHSAKRRAQDADRKMSARKADKCPQAEQKKSGPEKRREEKIEETHTPAPVASARRPSLDQAKAAAAQDGVAEEIAVQWWHAREASNWMKSNGHGGNVSVGSWRSDLKSYSLTIAQSNADRRPKHRQGEFAEPELRTVNLPKL